MAKSLLAVVALAAFTAGAAPRYPSVRAEFQRSHPCPATGAPRGACPGWQVDHVIPLKCNGADEASNMQWLTVHDHALKTKREARWCRKKSASGPAAAD